MKGMTTTNAPRRNRAVVQFPEVYEEGRQAFLAGAEIDSVPYAQSSKTNGSKRTAWYNGYIYEREQYHAKVHGYGPI